MGSMNTNALACNYAVSGVGVGGSKLNSKPSSSKLGVPKKMAIIKANSQNSTADIEKVDKVRRASLIGLGAALVASPFSSPAFADIIEKHNLTMETAALKSPIKVAAIGAELDKDSNNTKLLRAALEICAESVPGMQMEAIDITRLPLINTDLIVDGKNPPEVDEVRQKILDADSLFFVCAEYNYAITPLQKNVIDWASIAPNVLNDKPAAMVSAGFELGGGLSQFDLRRIGVRPNIHFVNQPQLFLRLLDPPPKFDNEGNLTDEAARETIKDILIALKKYTIKLGRSPIVAP